MTYDECAAIIDGEMSALLKLYSLADCRVSLVEAHDGGRNLVYIVHTGGAKYALRVSYSNDRRIWDYLAETEFVRYLASGGAKVADTVESANGRLVERVSLSGHEFFVSLFGYADGESLYEHGYRYRQGAPIDEYYFNCGKTLGRMHELSKRYRPIHRRYSFFDKYTPDFIDRIVPCEYSALKKRLNFVVHELAALEKSRECFGVVHFDYGDGNYRIDYRNGDITVFDFDDCCECFYMYDLASVWSNGRGWIAWEHDSEKRRAFMDGYFKTVVDGYRSETALSDTELERLPLFINAVQLESILNVFEVAYNRGAAVEIDEDDELAIERFINAVPYMGFFE